LSVSAPGAADLKCRWSGNPITNTCGTWNEQTIRKKDVDCGCEWYVKLNYTTRVAGANWSLIFTNCGAPPVSLGGQTSMTFDMVTPTTCDCGERVEIYFDDQSSGCNQYGNPPVNYEFFAHFDCSTNPECE